MDDIAIVKTDSKSRVVVRGLAPGQRVRVVKVGDDFRLELVSDPTGPRSRNPLRENLPMPALDLAEHLDRLEEAGLDWTPLPDQPVPACQF